ncbi:MAG: LLM class flavin-dependent oxidoreductase [Anaerolineaceae bacterium]|nr:LLM class flavin-dependent oxidoreductase [Anaerolineaceae bacterium]
MSGVTVEPLFGLFPSPDVRHVNELYEITQIADETGIDILSIQDHPYNGEFLDTWTLLASLARITRNIRLMTNVASTPLRYPPMLAKAAATLDILSGGRLELGVGSGAYWQGIASYGAPLRTPGQAVSALEEAVRVMRLIWNEDHSTTPVSFQGNFYQLNRATPGPQPVHPIRIWFGAQGPRMLKMTGRLGDGWSISSPIVSPQQLPALQEIINHAADEAGRDRKAIRRNYNVVGMIDRGKREASFPKPGVMVGAPDDWARQLASWSIELGMDSFIFVPAGGNVIEQIRLFAEQVVPRTRDILVHQVAG